MYSIYLLTDPRDEIVRYVGSCVHPQRRLKSHLAEALRGLSNRNSMWIRQLSALGLTPSMRVVATAQDRSTARFMEAETIEKYPSGSLFNRQFPVSSKKRGVAHSVKLTSERATDGTLFCISVNLPTVADVKKARRRALDAGVSLRAWAGEIIESELNKRRGAVKAGAKMPRR